MDNILSTILIIVGLIVGCVAGGLIFSTTHEVEVEKIVEVPVNVTVEVPSECDKPTDWLQLAVDEFLKAVDNEEDEAGNPVEALLGYDFDEVSVSKVYDEYTILQEGDDKTTVNFDVKLKYKDSHDTERHTYDVKVVFEDDEDTIVTATEF